MICGRGPNPTYNQAAVPVSIPKVETDVSVGPRSSRSVLPVLEELRVPLLPLSPELHPATSEKPQRLTSSADKVYENFAVVHGVDAIIDDWPWMVRIIYHHL